MNKHTPKTFGTYTVTFLGRVYSSTKWRGTVSRLMLQHEDDDGYSYVRLTLDGKRKKFFIHRLVCTLFHGPRPSDKHEVRHIDGNSLNNCYDNLAWGTRKENAEDRDRHGKTSFGKSHSQAIKSGIRESKNPYWRHSR